MHCKQTMDKKEQRKYIRSVKQTYSQEQLADMSADICRRLYSHPIVEKADIILLYWALPDEVITHGVVRRLSEEGKTVLLPKVISDTEMTLHQYTCEADMAVGSYGILEPIGNLYDVERLKQDVTQDGKAAVAVIPGMAFDREGHRLGRGKGYYDRMLSRTPYIYTIGLCYPFQIVESVAYDEYDVPVCELIY